MVEEYVDRIVFSKKLKYSTGKSSSYFLGMYDIDSITSIKTIKNFEVVETIDEYEFIGKFLTITSTQDFDSIEIEFIVNSEFPVKPETFKQAALIYLSDLFNNRQEIVVGRSVFNTNTCERLLNPYRKTINF